MFILMIRPYLNSIVRIFDHVPMKLYNGNMEIVRSESFGERMDVYD